MVHKHTDEKASERQPVESTQTSLARLSDHEWHILSNTWARGVDWYVRKVGRKWAPIDIFGAFPLFKTKREAEQAATTLLLWESRNRAMARNSQ